MTFNVRMTGAPASKSLNVGEYGRYENLSEHARDVFRRLSGDAVVRIVAIRHERMNLPPRLRAALNGEP